MRKVSRATKIKGVCWRCLATLGILFVCCLALMVYLTQNQVSAGQSDLEFAVVGYLLLAVACFVTFRNSCL